MCLAVPTKIVEIHDNDLATVNIGGVQKKISLALVENVKRGDYVIVHVGYALNRLDPDEAEKTLDLFRQVANEAGLAWPEDAP